MENPAPWSDQAALNAARRRSVIPEATVIYERLRGHPFMGCDCRAESVIAGVDVDDDVLYDLVTDLDRIWVIALDLAAAVLEIGRDGHDVRG